jgi:hypothetical protein
VRGIGGVLTVADCTKPATHVLTIVNELNEPAFTMSVCDTHRNDVIDDVRSSSMSLVNDELIGD